MKLKLTGLIVALALTVMSGACATTGNNTPRHIATVSVVTAHATLAAVQDAEMLLVCGKQGAPAAPQCIPAEKHKELSGYLVQAFDYDGQVARIVRALPPGQPQPGQVGELLGQIAVLVDKVLAGLPREAAQTQALLASLTAEGKE